MIYTLFGQDKSERGVLFMNKREELISQVKEQYANLAFAGDQQHFHQTTTGITPLAYYEKLSSAVISQIERGKFDSCHSGNEVINKVAADKTILPEWS